MAITPYCMLRKGRDNIAIDGFVLPIKMPPRRRLRREVDEDYGDLALRLGIISSLWSL